MERPRGITGGRSERLNMRRLVVKVGTSTLTAGGTTLAPDRLDALVHQIIDLRRSGREVVLVTSGAIVTGANRLGLQRAPRSIPARPRRAPRGGVRAAAP